MEASNSVLLPAQRYHDGHLIAARPEYDVRCFGYQPALYHLVLDCQARNGVFDIVHENLFVAVDNCSLDLGHGLGLFAAVLRIFAL